MIAGNVLLHYRLFSYQQILTFYHKIYYLDHTYWVTHNKQLNYNYAS